MKSLRVVRLRCAALAGVTLSWLCAGCSSMMTGTGGDTYEAPKRGASGGWLTGESSGSSALSGSPDEFSTRMGLPPKLR
jgi:hypothetical protein